MPKISGTEYMFNFVEEYLSGKMDRIDWDMDFNYYFMQHFQSMSRKNSDLAECFNFYIAEQGFDQGDSLNDSEHKKLIRKQWNEFKAAMHDGFN